MYTTLNNKDKDDLLARSGKDAYKFKGHSFVPMKGVGKQMCKCCGLVALNNKATNWCINKGCNYEDHSSHNVSMKRLTQSS